MDELAREDASGRAVQASSADLLQDSRDMLLRIPAFEARMRQRVDIFGHQIVGSGSYVQAMEDGEPLIRMELKLQLSNQLTSFQQIRNRRFLWTRRELPGQVILGRIDLRRLRESLEAQPSPTDAGLTGNWLALGGLPRLLDSLANQFDFMEPRAEVVGKAAAPVWTLEGAWKPEALARIVPAKRDEILAGQAILASELPPHIPDRVTVTLGRGGAVPLFPFRVQYLRSKVDSSRQMPAEPRFAELLPIATLELFEVQRLKQVDFQQFDYEPGNQAVIDETAAASAARVR